MPGEVNQVCFMSESRSTEFSISELGNLIKAIDWEYLSYKIGNGNKEESKRAKVEHKFYVEELNPLCRYVLDKYGANHPGSVVICKPHQKHYDFIICGPDSKNIYEYIQVTCAINTDAKALQAQALQEQDPSNGKIHNMLICDNQLAAQARDKRLPLKQRTDYAKEYKFSELQMVSVYDIKRNQVALIKEAIGKKITKSLKDSVESLRTLLIAYYANGQGCGTEHEQLNSSDVDELKQYCISNQQRLAGSAIDSVVIVNQNYMRVSHKNKTRSIELIWEASENKPDKF